MHFFQRFASQNGHAIMAFLAEIVRVVAHVPNRLFREFAVVHLGFLQAEQGRLILFQQRFQLVQARTNTVDIE
ncbi:hypothetical protein A0126_15525 [Exiguobacterium sp. N4-1P]|nr:hypothetical protein A0126_15525 [Exiguobacterium sp. N4-1P]